MNYRIRLTDIRVAVALVDSPGRQRLSPPCQVQDIRVRSEEIEVLVSLGVPDMRALSPLKAPVISAMPPGTDPCRGWAFADARFPRRLATGCWRLTRDPPDPVAMKGRATTYTGSGW